MAKAPFKRQHTFQMAKAVLLGQIICTALSRIAICDEMKKTPVGKSLREIFVEKIKFVINYVNDIIK